LSSLVLSYLMYFYYLLEWFSSQLATHTQSRSVYCVTMGAGSLYASNCDVPCEAERRLILYIVILFII
jgi:hypothetical protein